MKNVAVPLLFAATLAACNATPPASTALSGTLEPKSLELVLESTIADKSLSNSNTSKGTTTVTLVNGHLPSGYFAPQKTTIATNIEGWNVAANVKTDLKAGVNDGLDKLEADINAALDGLPRTMKITPTGSAVLDLQEANFEFATKAGTKFTMVGGYNPKTTEYLLLGINFARADGTNKGAILGVMASSFGGALSKTNAEQNAVALGALAIKDVGALAVKVGVRVTHTFTRDK